MRRGRGAPLAVALLLGGTALLLQGLWIPAKAALAQVLLQRAWEQTLRTGEPTRPWPGADTTPVARLRVPRLSVSLLVLEGATGASLAFGPGHLSGTPVPGEPGNSALAGHRDSHFRFLRELAPGDLIEVETPDRALHRYAVRTRRVVHERDTGVLAASDRAELTLLTCFPFDAVRAGGPLRYAVRAAGLETAPPSSPRF